jgi:hypothetical protein
VSIFTNNLENTWPKIGEIVNLYLSVDVSANPFNTFDLFGPQIGLCAMKNLKGEICKSIKWKYLSEKCKRHQFSCCECGNIIYFKAEKANLVDWEPAK